jgi:4-hydroxythreonine-4-phosphate dehydrogenase
MLFVYQAFRMLLLTRHVPLRQVSQTLTVSAAVRSLDNLVRFLRNHQGIETPRIAMMGVNPHAGEIGGEEEREILLPAMAQIEERHQLTLPPPFPADALFRGFNLNQLPFDAYVAAYHDQGLIPFKLVAGFQAVNVTIGLPFIRTSVSHGTAPDIVGQGIADPSSLHEAVQLAFSLN